MFYLCQVKSLWNWMQHQKANIIDLIAILAKLDGSLKGRAIAVLVELKCLWKRKSHHPLLLLNFGLQPSNILLVGKVSPFEKDFTFGPRIYKNIITMYKQTITTPQGWKKKDLGIWFFHHEIIHFVKIKVLAVSFKFECSMSYRNLGLEILTSKSTCQDCFTQFTL